MSGVWLRGTLRPRALGVCCVMIIHGNRKGNKYENAFLLLQGQLRGSGTVHTFILPSSVAIFFCDQSALSLRCISVNDRRRDWQASLPKVVRISQSRAKTALLPVQGRSRRRREPSSVGGCTISGGGFQAFTTRRHESRLGKLSPFLRTGDKPS